MKTYVKIEGNDITLIVQKLARLAVDSPEICVWDYNMLNAGWAYQPYQTELGAIAQYFDMDTGDFEKNCDKIIVKSGSDLGDDNIYFEWLTPPSKEQLTSLRRKIEGVIKPFGNKFRVTNRE